MNKLNTFNNFSSSNVTEYTKYDHEKNKQLFCLNQINESINNDAQLNTEQSKHIQNIRNRIDNIVRKLIDESNPRQSISHECALIHNTMTNENFTFSLECIKLLFDFYIIDESIITLLLNKINEDKVNTKHNLEILKLIQWIENKLSTILNRNNIFSGYFYYLRSNNYGTYKASKNADHITYQIIMYNNQTTQSTINTISTIKSEAISKLKTLFYQGQIDKSMNKYNTELQNLRDENSGAYLVFSRLQLQLDCN